MRMTHFRSLANELWNYVNKDKMTISEGIAILREKYKLTSYAIGHLQNVYVTSPLYRALTRLHNRKKAS
jgi:hypothetical protein